MTDATKHELCTNGAGFFDPTMGEVLLRIENEREIEHERAKRQQRMARERDRRAIARENGWTNMLISGNYKSYEPPKTPVTAA